MTRRLCVILLCLILLMLCGCTGDQGKYKRIAYDTAAFAEQQEYLKDDTAIVYEAKETFSSCLPMYEIEGQRISHEDYQQMLVNLKLDPDEFLECKRDGNQLYINLASPTDFSRGFFTMTEEEGEKLAWELFRKIPFMEGEYECLGIGDTCRYYDSQGIHIPRAGYVFCRTLDGVPVVGDESCVLHLDGSGLVAVSIRLYDYENVGTMDLVPLEAAKAKLKSPDDFDIGTASTQPYVKTVETLEVDQVSLRLVNQHSRKCEILQPVYYFTGEATYADGYAADFSSKVIAIPESYTD